MNKIIYILPIIVLGWLGYLQFSKPAEKDRNTQLISMDVPDFSFKEAALTKWQNNNNIITTKDLPHEVMMINIFASWCAACYREHDQLVRLAEKHNLTIYGIAHNDTEKSLGKFFENRKNPYNKLLITPTIYNTNKWGVIGMPESFILDANGKIRYRHKGPILKDHVDGIIIPIIKEISK